MTFHPGRFLLAALLILPGAAAAEGEGTLRTLAGPLELGQAYTPISRNLTREIGRSFAVSEVMMLSFDDGPLSGGRVFTQVRSITPTRTDDAMARAAVESIAQRAEEVEGFLWRRQVDVAGFPFQLIAGDRTEDGDGDGEGGDAVAEELLSEEGMALRGERRALRMMGAVGGSLLTITIDFPRSDEATEPLATALSRLALDLPGLLRQRAEFDDEAAGLIGQDRILTQFGELALPRGVQARLAATEDFGTRDAERRRGTQRFVFARNGAWLGEQYVLLTLSCSSGEQIGDAVRAEPGRVLRTAEGVTQLVGPTRVQVGGMDAERYTGRMRGAQGGAQFVQWTAFGETESYMLRLDSFNGRRIQRELEPQVAALRPDCPPFNLGRGP